MGELYEKYQEAVKQAAPEEAPLQPKQKNPVEDDAHPAKQTLVANKPETVSGPKERGVKRTRYYNGGTLITDLIAKT